MTKSTDDARMIKATEGSFDVIEELARAGELGVSELSNRLEIPVSTAFDHLYTLEKLGFVIKDTQNYRLSLRFLEVGGKVRIDIDLFNQSKLVITELARRTGYMSTLTVEEAREGVHIYTAPGDQYIPVLTPTGNRSPLHATAGGKAILAKMPDSRVREIIDQEGINPLTDNTITTEEDLFDEMKRIRDNGYAIDSEEAVLGFWGLAGPIISRRTGDVIGAVDVYKPAGSGGVDLEDISSQVLETANIIELNLTT